MVTTRRSAGRTPDTSQQINEVRLVGRLSTQPTSKQLPSGDELVSLRVVVRRPRATSGAARRPTVDAIDVVCWSAVTRRRALTLTPDDTIEVSGALRRRFWRGDGGVTSLCEVEARSVRRLARAG